MSFTTIFILAFALAMDAFAVALTTGFRLRAVSIAQTLRMAGAFGFFQGIMPVIGWLMGASARHAIEAYDHWLAFALLLFVAFRMFKEAWEEEREARQQSRKDAIAAHCAPPEELLGAAAPEESGSPLSSEGKKADPTRGSSLWLLAVATSIDALAVGISLALINIQVWIPALIIGLVCFACTVLGMHLGRMVCRLPGLDRLGAHANILGGVVLLGIGLTILHEHGVFQ